MTITLAEHAASSRSHSTDDLTIAAYLTKHEGVGAVSFPWTPGKSPLPRLTAAQRRDLGARPVVVRDGKVAFAILLTVGDSPVFEAAALIPGHWNGWAMPLFTREQAEAVLEWLNPLRAEDGDEPETLPEPTPEGLYPLGSGAWVWELADEAAVA